MSNVNLEELRKKQSQIEARIQMLKAKTDNQKRKEDTRRKILAGSYILDKYEKSAGYERLVNELEKFLFKKHDRELFGLPPRETEKAVPTKAMAE
jgi:vacuolar-type H+-ATPase subunit I/STV1